MRQIPSTTAVGNNELLPAATFPVNGCRGRRGPCKSLCATGPLPNSSAYRSSTVAAIDLANPLLLLALAEVDSEYWCRIGCSGKRAPSGSGMLAPVA
jgi:hypothetical protein